MRRRHFFGAWRVYTRISACSSTFRYERRNTMFRITAKPTLKTLAGALVVGANRSKLIVAVIALSGFASGSAVAHETGIINQAGPYEQIMQFPAHGFPGVAPTVQATDAVANTTKRADAGSAVIPSFALKAVSTDSLAAKPAASKSRPSGRGAPLTLYIENPAGNMVQLVHEP